MLTLDIYSILKEQADKEGVTFDDLLKQFQTVETAKSEKALTVSADERRRLEKLLGKNLSCTADLITMVERAMSLSTANVTIELSPYLLDRLKSRCIGMNFDDFLRLTVKRRLEEFVGIR